MYKSRALNLTHNILSIQIGPHSTDKLKNQITAAYQFVNIPDREENTTYRYSYRSLLILFFVSSNKLQAVLTTCIFTVAITSKGSS